MANILLDRPPDTVMIDGADYPINTDYRAGIQLDILINDDLIDWEDVPAEALKIYFPGAVFPPLSNEMVEAVVDFYRCGKPKPQPEQQRAIDEVDDAERTFSFEHDADYIFSAFLQQYGIDLTKSHMHWWVFMALFSGLSEDCTLVKIMGYRAAEISEDMPKEERKQLERMKELYALPRPKEEIEAKDRLAEILMGDGDLAEYFAEMEGNDDEG